MKRTKNNFSEVMAARAQTVQAQFQSLDPKDPSVWPVLPRGLLCAGLALLTAGAAWYFYLSSFEEDLERERTTEVSLRADYEKKLQKAVSLEGLKKQREQVQQYVQQLEKQLPSKSEMAALLSDINQAGLGRSLQFELFKPGSESVKEFYAELPISVKISGNYHDMGMFASDIAHLPRIVTLSNIAIAPKGKEGALTLDATAHTYRYLDSHEVQPQRKGAAK
jgi:type IV pilus assembly protein PilO